MVDFKKNDQLIITIAPYTSHGFTSIDSQPAIASQKDQDQAREGEKNAEEKKGCLYLVQAASYTRIIESPSVWRC